MTHINELSRLNLGSYGSPRMTEELKEVGVDVGHRQVARLMRENGIVVERMRKFKAEEGQGIIRGIVSPTTLRQRKLAEHRPKPLGYRLHGRLVKLEPKV